MEKINIKYNIKESESGGSFDLVFDKESVEKLGQELKDVLSDFEIYEVIKGEYFTMNICSIEDSKELFSELASEYENLTFIMDETIQFSEGKYPFYYALEDDSEIGHGVIILYTTTQEDFDRDNLISDNFNLKLVDYLENLEFIQIAESTFECPNKSVDEIKAILHSSQIFEFKENENLIII